MSRSPAPPLLAGEPLSAPPPLLAGDGSGAIGTESVFDEGENTVSIMWQMARKRSVTRSCRLTDDRDRKQRFVTGFLPLRRRV